MKKKKRKRKRIRDPGNHVAITEQVSNCSKTKIVVWIEMYQD
jgi:hypothetical protein